MVKPSKNQRRRNVSWDEIINLANSVAKDIQDSDATALNSIYGIPRGGLIVAVLLSHRLNLPIVEKDGINQQTLIVDDINDSGFTLQEFEYGFKMKLGNSYNIASAVLFQRKNSSYEADIIGEHIHKEWIAFPWELKNE